MKCPFKKKETVTKDYKKSSYSYNQDITEVDFGDCDRHGCMAYDNENFKCMMLEKK